MQHVGWKAVEKGDYHKLYLVDMVLPWISHLICSFIPTVVMCKLGVPVVENNQSNITYGWTCNEDFIHSW